MPPTSDHPEPQPPTRLGEDTTLRAAQLQDVPDLHALETRLFPADAWTLDMFLAEVGHPTRSYYVLEYDTGSGPSIIGYCGVMVVGDTADVQTIAVLPEHEGNGYGRAMLETMHTRSRQQGAERILLEVRADNPRAQRLYRRNGYTRIHVRPRYYDDGTDALIMLKELTAPTAPVATVHPPATGEHPTAPHTAKDSTP